MKTLVTANQFTGSVNVPQDGVDARTAQSLEGGFQALANRTHYLKSTQETDKAALEAQLTAANAKITTLEQTVQRLTTHTVSELNAPGSTYTLPANTDISVLIVSAGEGSSSSISTQVNLSATQSNGKRLGILLKTPPNTSRTNNDYVGRVNIVLGTFTSPDFAGNSTYYQLNRFNRYVEFIYVNGLWYPLNDCQNKA